MSNIGSIVGVALLVALMAYPVAAVASVVASGVIGALSRFTDRTPRQALKSVGIGGGVVAAIGVVGTALVSPDLVLGVALAGTAATLLWGVIPVGLGYGVLSVAADDDRSPLLSVLAAWPVAMVATPAILGLINPDPANWVDALFFAGPLLGPTALGAAIHAARARL